MFTEKKTKALSIAMMLPPVICMFMWCWLVGLIWVGGFVYVANYVYKKNHPPEFESVEVVESVPQPVRHHIEATPAPLKEPIKTIPSGYPEGKQIRMIWMKQYIHLAETKDWQEFITQYYLKRGLEIAEIKEKFSQKNIEYLLDY